MAHQSGYDGTITLTAAGDTEFGPSATTMKLESWTLRQTTDTFPAFAKGDSYKTKFYTASDWTATVVALVQAAMVATELDIRKTGTAAKAMTDVKLYTNTNDYFTGTGWVSSVTVDDPVDGPVKVTIEIEGNGHIVSTAA